MKAIDLYAGAGGVTAGLKMAGYSVRAAVEYNAEAAKSYRLNHPDVDLFEKDILAMKPSDFGFERGELDLLTACPPCQGFSSLGRGDPEDTRNDLVKDVWTFVRFLTPSFVVLENVPGLASDSRIGWLFKRMRAIGYSVRHWVVDASDFGVPQRRKRLIVIGSLYRSLTDLPSGLHRVLGVNRENRTNIVDSVFDYTSSIDVASDSLHRGRRHGDSTLQRIRAIPKGGSRFDLPPALELACHRKLGARNATSSYGRIKLGVPAPTMTTRCTTPSCGRFIHPIEDRGITLREAALIQTFPKDYSFAGSYQGVERQIGNALPVSLAFEISRVVRLLSH